MSLDGEGIVLAQLDARIAALDLAQINRLASDLDAIRRLATANGLTAMTPVIHAIEAAIGRGERGPSVLNGLALLRDAARCGADARHGATLAAACARRIAG